MPRKTEFRRDGDKYIALTGECPKGFKGILFVCFRGDNPGSVKEDVIVADQLKELEEVEGADVPADWAEAFEQEGVKMPKPEKPSISERRDEFVSHLAAGTDLYTAAAVSQVFENDRKDEELTDEQKMQQAVEAAWGFLVLGGIATFITWLIL